MDGDVEKLTSQLEQIASVDAVSSAVGYDPDAEISDEMLELDHLPYLVTLTVEVHELVEADVIDMVEAVEATMEAAVSRVGNGHPSYDLALQLHNSDGVVFTDEYPLGLSSLELANEVRYWLALTAAYGGPLAMNLYPAGIVARSITPLRDTLPVDWEALRAVPDASAMLHDWKFDGLWASDSLPTDEVIELHNVLAGIPLGDGGSLSLDRYRPGSVTVGFFSPAADLVAPTASTAWPQVLDAVQRTLDAGTPANFAFFPEYGGGAAHIHLGECTAVRPASETDAALADALAASTLDLSAGIGAGYCGDYPSGRAVPWADTVVGSGGPCVCPESPDDTP